MLFWANPAPPSASNFHLPWRTAACCRPGKLIRQKNVRSSADDLPDISGNTSMPSLPWEPSVLEPVAARIEAVRSIPMIGLLGNAAQHS